MRGRKHVKVGVLFSGGKDSSYTAYKIAMSSEFSLTCLITLLPADPESFLFHHINSKWTSLQAEAMKVPHLTFKSKSDERVDLSSALRLAKENFGIEALATGGILSKFQERVFRNAAERVGLEYISPIWMIDQKKHLFNLYHEGFKVMITKVSALGLGKEWLGKVLDLESIKKLIHISEKYRFNPSLEGGEGETFVLDMPLFKKEIKVMRGEVIWEGDSGIYLIKEAVLVNKKNV
jgi:ABC transporter with metal-binding/Fe-S-binding domain ATP-binding protein